MVLCGLGCAAHFFLLVGLVDGFVDGFVEPEADGLAVGFGATPVETTRPTAESRIARPEGSVAATTPLG